MNKGYRAFLLGTATDLPCAGLILLHRRETDEDRILRMQNRRRVTGVSKVPPTTMGVVRGNDGTEGN